MKLEGSIWAYLLKETSEVSHFLAIFTAYFHSLGFHRRQKKLALKLEERQIHWAASAFFGSFDDWITLQA